MASTSQTPSRRALERTNNQGNQLPPVSPRVNPAKSSAAASLQREDSLSDEDLSSEDSWTEEVTSDRPPYSWEEELADVNRVCESMERERRAMAEEDLRFSRRTGDRFAMMRSAMSESMDAPTNRSTGFRVLNEDNAAALRRAQAAHEAATAGRRKRKSTCLQDDIDDYKQDLGHIDTSGMHVDLDCNQVRALIHKVLDNGIMKKVEFCNAIGASNAAVNAFLQKRWPMDGWKSQAFLKAWGWFKQREIAGLKMPNANKRRQTEAARAAAGRATSAGASASASASTGATTAAPTTAASTSSVPGSAIPDISGIHLPGEDTDEVPVYETCDVVREKIDAHLDSHRVTLAQFCRDIYAQLKSPTRCKGIQPKQLADFRGKQGPNAGATSSVFYAAYVYFEKIRLAQGAPKSEHRVEMERRWPEGFDREHDDRCP